MLTALATVAVAVTHFFGSGQAYPSEIQYTDKGQEIHHHWPRSEYYYVELHPELADHRPHCVRLDHTPTAFVYAKTEDSYQVGYTYFSGRPYVLPISDPNHKFYIPRKLTAIYNVPIYSNTVVIGSCAAQCKIDGNVNKIAKTKKKLNLHCYDYLLAPKCDNQICAQPFGKCKACGSQLATLYKKKTPNSNKLKRWQAKPKF